MTEALGHGLENAARYSPAGSTIHVSVGADDDRTSTSALPTRARASRPPSASACFERFVRLEDAARRARKRPRPFIARSLVALNGGRLRLGEAEGGGTLFEIALPRSAAMSRVLVADDEPAIRKVVRDALEREGHEVVAAIDGQEALERFEEGAFDLVVTDLAMPRVGRPRARPGDPPARLRRPDPRPDRARRGAGEGAPARRGRRRLRHEALRRRRARGARPGAAAARETGAAPRTVALGATSRSISEARTVRKARPAGPPDAHRVLAPADHARASPGAVWTHRQLLAAVWGTTAGVTNDTLRVHVGSLRRKLEDDPNRPRWFRTEPWVGYRFSPE